MTLFMWVLLAVGVLAAAGVLGLMVLVLARRWARTPDRAPVAQIAAADLGDYFARRAGFCVTVSAQTPLSPSEVFDRLVGRAYLSTLPFLDGPHWVADDVDTTRGVGSKRTMSGTVYSVSEKVIQYEKDVLIALSGTAVCTPWTIASFAEEFTIAPTERTGVSEVRWTIAGTPRWVGWLPWRWGAPLTRPVFAFVLRHVLRVGAFRAPRTRDGRTEGT
ncbi:SRPBCC family protein [Gordonia crocea]|nr:SRPBCC family protein [Gordonia crocea]